MSPLLSSIRPGLVSVTFRALAPREVVRLAASCGLEAIEWGGDVHVPDVASADEVRRITEDEGLSIAAYGSYWRATGAFEPILETALALGAPTVRVWAGTKGSAEESDRKAVASALRQACELAQAADLTVSLEWHGGTLTDTLHSALRLVKEIEHPALRLLWQPVPERSHEAHLAELQAILPRLGNLHVFQWTKSSKETVRHPLAEGERVWREVFDIAKHGPPTPSQGEGRFALLEFVPNDDPHTLPAEANTLRRLLSETP